MNELYYIRGSSKSFRYKNFFPHLVKPELPPIRHAHILSMLVRALVYAKDYSEAGKALKQLAVKDNSWSASGLLDRGIVLKIAQECDLDFDLIWNSGRQVTASTSGTAATGMSSTSAMTTSEDDEADDEEITEELH